MRAQDREQTAMAGAVSSLITAPIAAGNIDTVYRDRLLARFAVVQRARMAAW